jgi:uncharacterized membrane protein
MSKHRNRRNNQSEIQRHQSQPAQASGEFRVTAQSFSGPLPHPTILAQYNGLFPGGAERIVAMAERNQAHRHEIETIVVRGNVRAQSRGQWFGLIVAVIGMAGAIWLIAHGQTWGGVGLGGIDVLGLAGLFIYSHESKKRELRGKAEDLLMKPLSGPNAT